MRRTPGSECSITSSHCSTQWPVLLLPVRLEVRRIENELCIRVFPDQPFIHAHKESLTAEEAAAAVKLQAILAVAEWRTNSTSVASARAEWAELARRFGPQRAAWIYQVLVSTGSVPVTTNEDAAIPTLFMTPERFVFLVYQNHQLVYHECGADITGSHTLLPAPPAATDDSEPADGLFDDASRWVTSFDAAVIAGLGIKIPLIPDHIAAAELKFSEIVVVGIMPGDQNTGAQAFEDFVGIHRYTDGVEFIPYGTPTNNTQQTPSGFSESTDELIASFDQEVAPTEPWIETAAEDVQKALGLPSGASALKGIKGATLTQNDPMQSLIDAVWPCTGDYFFSEILGYQSQASERTMVYDYVRKHLRPGGHFPTLRIGNLPYGILPATRIKLASSLDTTGWKTSDVDYRLETTGLDWASFDEALLNSLGVFLPLWLERANDTAVVPRAGSSSDPDDEMLRLLGMAPHPLDYGSRPVVDQVLILLLYRLFQNTLFGSTSSFDGLVTTANFDPRTARSSSSESVSAKTAAGAWAYEWQETIRGRRELFEELDIAPHLKYLPPILEMFTWGAGTPSGMSLVRVPPPAPDPNADPDATPPPPPPTDGPEVYLPLFGATTAPAATSSNTILFDLLRRSVGREAQLPTALQQVSTAITTLRDYPVLEFFNHSGTPDALAALASRDTAIGEFDDVLDALMAPPDGGYKTVTDIETRIGDAALLAPFAQRLRFDFSTRLENHTRDIIGALTSRLDSWFTSLAARRLDGMRAGSGAGTGLYCGGFGYLEDVRLRKHSLTLVEQDPGAGYIHAPTISQASAAALLRSAFVTHRNDTKGNAYAVNLSSQRVNKALSLIDGVRQGQDLAALLGYQFERALHDEGFDRIIDDFRVVFPVTAPEGEDSAEAAESIGARDVCDGRAIADAVLEGSPKIEQALSSLPAEDRGTPRLILKDLTEINDAVSDLLLFEGIYQAAQGNAERAGAALDACAGLGMPPEIESVATPSVGPNLRHRVCLLLPWVDLTSAAGARAAADPTLNDWTANVLGDLRLISCTAHFTPVDSDATHEFITLAELQPAISTIDFVYMCAAQPGGKGDTEIESRIRRRLRQKRIVAENSDITLKFDEAAPEHSTLEHALEVGRSLLELLGNTTVLTPPNLTRPDEAPSPPFYADTRVTEISSRATAARTRLSDQLTNLGSTDVNKVRPALDIAAEFGIPEAVIDRDDDPAILERGRRVTAIATKRVDAAALLIAASSSGSGDARMESAVNALKTLFGDGFAALPAFDASMIASDNRAQFKSTTAPEDPGDGRLWLWFQQVAETHPRVRRLETFLIHADAWGHWSSTTMAPALELAQLPRTVGKWQALSDLEMANAPRVTGTQSIVAIKPATVGSTDSLDLTHLTGFVIDEWTEFMPAQTVTTGVSFEYNQPASQAPQCFLLAVPGNFDDPAWTAEHLASIVRDTMELAKTRLVDLDALPNVGGLAPALMFPITPSPVQSSPGTG